MCVYLTAFDVYTVLEHDFTDPKILDTLENHCSEVVKFASFF